MATVRTAPRRKKGLYLSLKEGIKREGEPADTEGASKKGNIPLKSRGLEKVDLMKGSLLRGKKKQINRGGVVFHENRPVGRSTGNRLPIDRGGRTVLREKKRSRKSN